MTKLLKVVTRSKKRRGQGGGSGKGFHTTGRGQKGQKARTKVHILFEGLKMKKSLLRRLPLLRGKDKFRGYAKPLTLKLEALNVFTADSKVDLQAVIDKGLVDKDKALKQGVKILAGGKLTKKLQILLPMSKKANA